MNQKEDQKLKPRPPVVVILGHVDHGKTSLLLAIRKMNVPSEKPGGVITQHIGAYQINKDGKKITFIDTPGHEAFSAMRSRGAKVADIAVLTVDSAEGVKAQTKEAILHIKKFEIPMIIAVNKIDKSEADPEKVKRELAKEDILTESMGGKIPSVEVSAKTGKGIEDLLEVILLVAEMEDFKADIEKPAEGVVIESHLDSQRGPIATLILNQGKLKPGQVVGTSTAFGKIKNLEDFQGSSISEAFPSQPVIILGFEDIPRVGDQVKVFSDLESAKTNLKNEERDLKENIIREDQKVLNLILKADVLGSLEAIRDILENLPQEKVALRILKSEVGEVTESDIKTAIQAKAKILSFRVKTNQIARMLAEREKVRIMQFEVVYDLVEGVRNYMERLLEPEIERINLGKMKVLEVFLVEKNRQIVGGRVTEGQLKKRALIEIERENEVVGRGKLINLQRNKKDAESVSKGEECGVLYEGNVKIEKDDILTMYIEEKRKGGL